MEDSDDELPEPKKQAQATLASTPDELETQVYRMNTDIFQHGLTDCEKVRFSSRRRPPSLYAGFGPSPRC